MSQVKILQKILDEANVKYDKDENNEEYYHLVMRDEDLFICENDNCNKWWINDDEECCFFCKDCNKEIILNNIKKIKKILSEAEIKYNKDENDEEYFYELLCDNELSMCENKKCHKWWYNSNPKSNMCEDCSKEYCYDCEEEYLTNDLCKDCNFSDDECDNDSE